MINYFSCFLFPVFFFFFCHPFKFLFLILAFSVFFILFSVSPLYFSSFPMKSFYSHFIPLPFSWFHFYIQKLTLLIWVSHWSTSNDMLTLGSSSCAVCRTFYNQALHALSPCMPLSMISYKHILISPLTFSFLVVNQA